jgi:hypothetical protein
MQEQHIIDSNACRDVFALRCTGKTTLVKAVPGLAAPDVIVIRGKASQPASHADAPRRSVIDASRGDTNRGAANERRAGCVMTAR